MWQVAGRNATGFYVQMYAYSHGPSTQPNARPRYAEHPEQCSQFYGPDAVKLGQSRTPISPLIFGVIA